MHIDTHRISIYNKNILSIMYNMDVVELNDSIAKMRRLSADIRIQTIKALANAGYGHIGGAMSVADVLGVLYGGVMNVRPHQPDWEQRDYLVVSKGHSGPAVYAALALRGYFPMEWLDTINQGGTPLPSHCDRRKTPGIDMTTGSLGQGFSAAVGIALGNRLKGLDNYTYCIIGDGEMQEGQVWEAAMCAAQNHLDKLILFIDDNKKQLDGFTKDICDIYDICEKFTAFGWEATSVKGYDAEEIAGAVESAKRVRGKPSAIRLDTLKGLGCCFAENVFNHYMNITQQMADEAIAEIERRYAAGTFPGGDLEWQLN